MLRINIGVQGTASHFGIECIIAFNGCDSVRLVSRRVTVLHFAQAVQRATTT